MFGIIRPCRHRLPADLQAAWLGHLCGLCLALRDEHGHGARLATNYDGLVVSALVDAQTTGGAGRRRAGPCLLRGLRGADVAVGDGPRLAAAVSLVPAAAKTSDHADDGDGLLGRRPLAAGGRHLARRWTEAGRRTGVEVGFDTAVLARTAARQRDLEATAGPGTPVTAVTEPTESAVAAAFAHTAVLVGRPANAEPLQEAGRAFGRIAHLLDAVEDVEADRRSGAWNPLAATGAGLDEVRRLTDEAADGLRLALRRAELADGRLVHALLVHEVGHAIERTFGHYSPDGRWWWDGQRWVPVSPSPPGGLRPGADWHAGPATASGGWRASVLARQKVVVGWGAVGAGTAWRPVLWREG